MIYIHRQPAEGDQRRKAKTGEKNARVKGDVGERTIGVTSVRAQQGGLRLPSGSRAATGVVLARAHVLG